MDRGGSGVLELNENLGRELLELHTVGRDAGYTENMVKDSAKLLTGYYVDRFKSWEYGYNKNLHYTGAVTIMDFHDANSAARRPAGAAALPQLPGAPPGDGAADRPQARGPLRLRQPVRRASSTTSPTCSGAPAPTSRRRLRALVNHPEFKNVGGKKVKTPTEDVVATFRAYGIKVKRPRPRRRRRQRHLLHLPHASVRCRSAGGRRTASPTTRASGRLPARMMGSYHAHYSLAGGWWPNTGVDYRLERLVAAAEEDPLRPVRRPPVPRAARPRRDQPDPRRRVHRHRHEARRRRSRAKHFLVQYRLPKLLGILLDTPQFLTR